jgi:hypothetical protein
MGSHVGAFSRNSNASSEDLSVGVKLKEEHVIFAALDINGKLDVEEAGDGRWPGHLDPQVVSIRTEGFIEPVVILCNDSILGRLRWICAENMSQPLLKFNRIRRRPGAGESGVRRAAQSIFELGDQVARFG